MLLCVFVLSCLLCSTSSAPLSSDDESWPTSSSGEDLQLSAVFPVVGVASPEAPPPVPEAPPRLVVQVEDTKTNITVSFAIFIIAEEEEGEEGGSAAGARARSDDDSRSSEVDDITDDVTSEETKSQDIQPMREEHTDHMIITESSEEVMRDQPMRNDHTTVSDDLDDFNNSTGSEASPLSDDSDGPAPPPPADLHRHRQADKPDPDPGLQEGMSSSSEETGSVSQDGGGSGLQAVTGSIQEVLGLLTGSQAVEGGHQEVLGSAPDPLPGFSLSSEESMESSVHHTGSTEPSQRVIGPTASLTPASASHSAEQGQEGGGLSEVMRSPEVSSSSEEATLTFTSSPTQSEESGSSGSEPDHPGLHPDHIPTSASSEVGPEESASSEVGPEESASSEVGPEESVRPDEAIREANGASSEASVQVTPDGGLKKPEEEESSEATADPTTPLSIHASSGDSSDASSDANTDASSDANTDASSDANTDASSDANTDANTDASSDANTDASSDANTDASSDANTDANTDASSDANTDASSDASSDANTDNTELSVEDDVSIEATAEPAVSIQPTDTNESRAEPAGSRASTDASSDASTDASRPLPLPLPRRPYRFGFLGPISHSYGDQSSSGHHSLFSWRHRERHHQVTHGSNRKQNGSNRKQRVSVAVVANPAQSSSEETE